MPEDFGVQEGATLPLGPVTPFSSLPQSIQDSANKATRDWGDADQRYWSAREQQIGPLLGAILSIGGGVFAPLLGPLLAQTGIGAGLSNLGASALIGGGAGTLGGLVAGEPFGQALEGGVLNAGGQFLGGELGSALHGLTSGAGAFGGGLGGAAEGGLAAGAGAGLGAAGSTLGNTISELIVNGAPGASLSGILSGVGGGLGGAAGGILGGATNPGSTFGSEFDGTTPPVGGAAPPGQGIHVDTGGFGGPSAPSSSSGDTTVDPITVTANNGPGGLNPGSVIGALNDFTDISGIQNPGNTPLQSPQDQGKPDINKLINDLRGLLGGGGPVSSVLASRPNPQTAGGGPTGPAGGAPGNPVAGGPGSNGPASLGTPGSGAAPAPGLLTTGAGTGGSGVGLGGPGQADVRGSTAPDIYPWVGQGQGGGL